VQLAAELEGVFTDGVGDVIDELNAGVRALDLGQLKPPSSWVAT